MIKYNSIKNSIGKPRNMPLPRHHPLLHRLNDRCPRGRDGAGAIIRLTLHLAVVFDVVIGATIRREIAIIGGVAAVIGVAKDAVMDGVVAVAVDVVLAWEVGH